MTQPLEARTATRLLRLLIGDPGVDPDDIDWRLLAGLARRERVAQRLAGQLEVRDARIPPRFGDAVERARGRTRRVLVVVQQIGEACERNGIPHVFLKLAQHLPDTGRDLDVLVGAHAADRLVLDRVPALPGDRPPRHWLAGTSNYPVPACPTTIDLHHGRLGRLGEHRRVADVVMRRRRTVVCGGVACAVPSPEDQMLLQGVAQCSGVPHLRLKDVWWIITTVRDARVDWSAVVAAAEATGLLTALSCRLTYVDQIHTEVAGRPLLDASARARLVPGDWGRVAFRDGAYRFATARIAGRLYLHQLRADLAAGDWAGAGRICLLPVAAVGAGLRRISGPHPRGGAS